MTTLDDSRHGLEDGDFVTFTEVKGMDGFNESEPRKVTVKGVKLMSNFLECFYRLADNI